MLRLDEGFLFWVNDEETGGSLSLNIEITAYCLLTYLERGLLADALSIARWLVAQRNSNGGFVSTQVLSITCNRARIISYISYYIDVPGYNYWTVCTR